MNEILLWDMYEVSTTQSSINGVMFRGRVRKFALKNQITFLAENTQDAQNGVRFAVLADTDISKIREYVIQIVQVLKGVANPVLSKVTVNDESRYTI